MHGTYDEVWGGQLTRDAWDLIRIPVHRVQQVRVARTRTGRVEDEGHGEQNAYGEGEEKVDGPGPCRAGSYTVSRRGLSVAMQ